MFCLSRAFTFHLLVSWLVGRLYGASSGKLSDVQLSRFSRMTCVSIGCRFLVISIRSSSMACSHSSRFVGAGGPGFGSMPSCVRSFCHVFFCFAGLLVVDGVAGVLCGCF